MGKGKPRWQKKLNGHDKLDICGGCGYLNCDPMYGYPVTPYIRKMEHRKTNGLCIACGHKVCTCKNLGRKSWRFK